MPARLQFVLLVVCAALSACACSDAPHADKIPNANLLAPDPNKPIEIWLGETRQEHDRLTWGSTPIEGDERAVLEGKHTVEIHLKDSRVKSQSKLTIISRRKGGDVYQMRVHPMESAGTRDEAYRCALEFAAAVDRSTSMQLETEAKKRIKNAKGDSYAAEWSTADARDGYEVWLEVKRVGSGNWIVSSAFYSKKHFDFE